MNLTRVLNSALPDIPARKLAESTPRLDPGISFREHIEDGRPVVRIYVPCVGGMFTFEKNEWELTQLFDGKRSFEQIAALYSQQLGVHYDEDSVRDFAASLEASDFWYRTSQEQNIQLMQLSREERLKKLKKKDIWADLSDVDFPAFNPDRFVTWLHDKTLFIYTPWFTIVSLVALSISGAITVAHWSQIWQDSLDFFLWKRTWTDIFYLYTVGMAIVALHELAHAHACKHCGGRVPAMGFALVYLLPAFFTDTTEGFVKGTLFQRITIAFAGVWSELLLYAVATPIWWGSTPGTGIHNAAYFVMILCGFMNVIVNFNPLIRLDGYFILCDIVGITSLKEDSTAYTSAWVKKHVWCLPVEVPYVPKNRRLAYVAYALASGAYSYMVLYILASFAGNIVRSFSQEWGFVPELGVAALIFRSRIRLLVNFMKFLYLDKKDRIQAWFTPQHTAMTATLLAILLAIPFWKESVAGRFVLEPVELAAVRAHVPGKVSGIYVREGEAVSKGAPVATLSNLALQSNLDDARAKLLLASAVTRDAEIHYQGYGNALMEKKRSQLHYGQVSEMNAGLELKAPIGGTILTPRVQDQLGAYLTAGTELLEIADLSQMRARIYTLEYDLNKIRGSQTAKLQLDGILRRKDGQVAMISARPVEPPPWAAEEAGKEAKSIGPQKYYFVDILVKNPGDELKPGMTGIARVYGSRRSVGGMVLEVIKNFWGRKLW
ncbi:MAG TPA: HlyD family efflux transporter periplasmic adaptor subunit [Candidatus Sulfotelmatobacter sp.]|jgi:putative peptide zinc metalloprotease protein|nr:HlyD family efflux transporter periplasmic adaptor subunit [Candidatus Sulfotelmatobacter sp.]